MINESEVSLSVSEYKYEDLTAKQQKLITGLMAGLPKAEAYRQAYPDAKIANPTNQVDKMIKNEDGKFPKFSIVYADMEAEALKRIEAEKENAIASRLDVALFLTKVMNGEIEDNILRFIGDGVQATDKIEPALRDRLNAAEKLGKYYGMFRDKVDVSGTAAVTIIDDMDNDDE